jgi:putative hydrolase of the HAD superfamily
MDWGTIRFVVFDVDGTLYEQRALRLRMVRELLAHVLRSLSLNDLLVVRRYRILRERMAEAETAGFDARLLDETARSTGVPTARVRAIVQEWIEERPLPYLMAARIAGIDELFAGLQRSGKVIGVLSDYPAQDKLARLGLRADFIACAPEPRIDMLKPHPKGLETLMADAGFAPQQTVLIGDRVERDGAAALRAGAHSLIRSARPQAGIATFRDYRDPLFAPLLRQPA